MASISTKKNRDGSVCWKIQFFIDGKRKTLTLPSRYKRRQAEELSRLIEDILVSRCSDVPISRRQQVWIDDMGSDLRNKLIQLKLVPGAVGQTLENLWDAYFDWADKAGHADNTLRNKNTVAQIHMTRWGKNTLLEAITREEVDEWFADQRIEYAPTTIASNLKICKTVWNWGITHNLCFSNPFTDRKKGNMENKERERDISMTVYHMMLDACPDQTWRTILALCRIGGLRCPCEVLKITWSDINWEKKRLRIRSSKLKRYEDKCERIIPLWPELDRELSRQFEEAEPGGSPYVVSDHRTNIYGGVERIVFHAGLQKWPRLVQNLRTSRSNELFASWPAHIASYWMGQSYSTAMKYYLHVSDNYYNRAVTEQNDKYTDDRKIDEVQCNTDTPVLH